MPPFETKPWREYALAALVAVSCLLYVAGLRPEPPGARELTPAAGDELVVDVTAPAAGGCSGADAGRCERGGFAPLAGARVRVFQERAGLYYPLPEARAGEAGQARIARATGALWVLVDAPGWARQSQALGAGVIERHAAFALARAEPLSVRVLNEQRAPVAEATVLVRGADPLPYAALTNAEGLASFAALSPPYTRVDVHARGYESLEVAPGEGKSLEVVLKAPSGLSVSLQDESGQPLPRAELWVAGLAIWPPRKVVSDEQGVLRLNGLAPGAYDLKAQLEKRVSAVQLGVAIEPGEQRRLALTLQPGRQVTVRVSAGDEQGPPIAGADVLLVEGGLSPFPIAGRTAGDGKVELGPMLAGKAVLSVSADGYVPRTLLPVPERGDASVAVALLRGGTLGGRVNDAHGRAIEGARIEIIGTDVFGRPLAVRSGLGAAGRGFFERVLAQPLPLTPAGELGVTDGPLAAPRAGALLPIGAGGPAELGQASWISRLDGSFRIDEVPPGRVRVLVSHPDYVEATSDAVDLASGAAVSVSVVLGDGAALEGQVLDTSGSAVASARVDLVGTRSTLHQSQKTDGAGRFSFRAVPPEVNVQLARPEDSSRFVLSRRLQLTLGERRQLTLVLPEVRGKVALRVTDPDGKRLADAQLSVLSLDAAVPLRRTLFSNREGEATLPDAEGLALNVRVDVPGFQPFSATLDHAPPELDFVLARGLELTGSVTYVRGRRPVVGASVALLQAGVRRQAKTDDRGSFRLPNVSPGNVRLRVSHPDFAPEELVYDLHASGEPSVELPAIDLTEAGGVTGVVLDRQGQPVSGARVGVGVVPAFLPVGPLPAGLVLTDAAGRFHLLGLPEGLVRISAYAAGVGRGSVEGVEVTEGHTIEGVELRLSEDRPEGGPSTVANLAVTLGERAAGEASEIVIVHVAERSEAERAGLLSGDVLRAIDDSAVHDMRDARNKLGGPEGSDVVLQVRRGASDQVVRVRRERVRR